VGPTQYVVRAKRQLHLSTALKSQFSIDSTHSLYNTILSDSQQFWTTYRPWGRRINTLCSHLKTFLSKNFDQSMHKNALFFEKKN